MGNSVPKSISILWMTQKILSEQYIKSNLDLWLCDLTFNRVYLLCRSKTCPKQVSKGLKYLKWTTHWAQKSPLTLTFEHVPWKSIGIIYLLGATPAPSLVLIKWRDQKILSGQHSGLKRVVWPWSLNMWPWKSIGIIYSLRATPAQSMVLIKWRVQKILSGQHLVYRPTDRQLQNNMPTFSRGA